MTLPTPTHYWNLDKSSGLSAKDEVGGATMQIDRAEFRPGKDGKADTALRFSPEAGAGARVVTTSVTELSSPTWTVSMWIRHEAKTGVATLLSSPTANIRLEQYGTASKLGVTKRGVEDYTSSDEIPVDDKWAHLVFVGTASTTTIYINGQARTAIPQSIKLPLKSIGSTDGTEDFGAFLLDELKAFDKALTDEQVKELYEQKVTSEIPTRCWAWGYNANGELGIGNSTNVSAPTQTLLRSGGIRAIAAGTNFNLALLEEGTLWAWGQNNTSQLGIGDKINRTAPVEVPLGAESRVKAIACGRNHSLVLLENGTVRAWGDNTYGQHGAGSAAAFQASEQVTMFPKAKAIAVAGGGYHSLALLDDGSVLSWGHNGQGQLGTGTAVANLFTPSIVWLPGRAKAIVAGCRHSLALLENGTVWGWGWNNYGQVGDGTAGNASRPVHVVGLNKPVIAIATQDGAEELSHNVALLEDGTVWAWGANTYGQLGNGTTSTSYLPVQVLGLNDVKAVAAGGLFGMALKRDGTLWSWGYNGHGALGNNTTTTTSRAVQVVGLSGIKAITAGNYHSVAIG